MASEAQILANRENAKKSCGPASDAGKRASSRNSTIHGIFVSIPALDEEEAEQLTTLYTTLCQDLSAGSHTECLIVWNMAVAHFRLQRAIETEKAYYLADRLTFESDPANSEIPWTTAAGYKRLTASGDLPRLTRYQRGFERTWEKNMAELRRLQAGRGVRERQEAAAARETERREEIDDACEFFRNAPSLDSFSKEQIADMEAQLAEFHQQQKQQRR